jgi:hypothetical protein
VNQNRDNKTFDKVLVGFCLLLILFCGYLLSDGRWIEGNDDTSNLKAVGQVSFSDRDVRRKHESGLSWSNARESDSVYEGDSIFTGDTSKAKVALKGGNSLSIDPKSLVVIRTNGDNIELDLKYGAVAGQLAGGQNLIFHGPNGESQVLSGQNAHIEFSQDQGKKAKIKVLSGKLEVKDSRTGITKTVQKNESVDVATQPTPVPKVAKQYPPPTLTFPAPNQLFITDKTNPKDHTVSFSWSDSVPYSSYDLQVSKDKDFKLTSIETNLKGQTLENAALDQGVYFWRVRGQGAEPNDSNKKYGWSESRPFEVKEKSPPPAPQVSPSLLLTNYILPYSKALLTQANIKALGKGGIAVDDAPKWTWPALAGANSYEVTVTGPQKSEKYTSEKPGFQLTQLAPGHYKWSVRGVFANEPLSPSSPPAVLRVSLPAPLTDETKTTELNYQLKWKPLLFAASYELEWSATADFKKGLKQQKYEKKAEASLLKSLYAKEGGLYWHVRALNKIGEPISAYSKTQILREKVLIPMAAKDSTLRTPASQNIGADSSMMIPALREPRPNTSVVSLGQTEGFLTFRWKGPLNSSYRLEVSKTPDFSDLILTKVTKRSLYVTDNPLPVGTLYWRVRAERPDAHSKWADPSPFSVSTK